MKSFIATFIVVFSISLMASAQTMHGVALDAENYRKLGYQYPAGSKLSADTVAELPRLNVQKVKYKTDNEHQKVVQYAEITEGDDLLCVIKRQTSHPQSNTRYACGDVWVRIAFDTEWIDEFFFSFYQTGDSEPFALARINVTDCEHMNKEVAKTDRARRGLERVIPNNGAK